MIIEQLNCRRSWSEMDLSKIIHNYEIYASNLPKAAQIMAVVKADAYGHGDVRVAQTLQSVGVSLFAVSNIEEAITLRKEGIQGEILILGYTPISLVPILKEYDITQALLSEEYALAFSKVSADVKCQFAINTGMNRIGLHLKDIDECERVVRYYADCIRLNGLFTHFSVADSIEEQDVLFTKAQLKAFQQLKCRISDLNLEYIHCMNSAGGIMLPNCSTEIVRLGIVLYGLPPSKDVHLPYGIVPALEWKSVVSMVNIVEQGDYIGYGRTFCANKKMKIATIPTGYADGYSRALSNKGCVWIHGQKAPIVGRICMDQMMVDVTDISNVELGDEVVLIGSNYSAEDMAKDIGTIGYEVLCGISKRVLKLYVKTK